MEKWKYIHLFTIGNPLFASRFITTINKWPNYSETEHLFVIQLHEPISNDQIIQNKNVIIENTSINCLKKYLPFCKYIFVHNLRNSDNITSLKKCDLNKIIWRTWGSDIMNILPFKNIPLFDRIHYPKYYISYLKNIIHNKRKNYVVRNIKAVCGNNIIDYLNLNMTIKNKPFFYINYDNDYSTVEPKQKLDFLCSNKIVIMIGHSGFYNENHMQIIDKLKSLLDFHECILLVPLAYGAAEKIEEIVKNYSNVPNIKLILDSFPKQEWNWILSNIDIAIMDSTTSTGLDTIAKLVRYRKTIYLNGEGIIAKGFKQEQIPFYDIESIDNNVFSKDNLLSYNAEKTTVCFPDQGIINERLSNLFYYLNKCN